MNTEPDIISTFHIDGTQVQLHSAGLRLTTPAGRVEVEFSFPALGRPAFPTATGSTVQVLDASAITAPSLAAGANTTGTSTTGTSTTGTSTTDAIRRTVLQALQGRLALHPVGGGDVVPLLAQPAGQQAAGNLDIVLTGSPVERQLYDIALRADDGSFEVVAAHAVYYRPRWSDFGLAHITDTHVARRIDGFREALLSSGMEPAAARLINWNNRFRGFVRYANQLHAQGDLDLIVATGDLIDYQYEADDDPTGPGNALFLRQLILGRAPGPDFPDVEELRVPIVLTPGNHDYRRRPYELCFDIHPGAFGIGFDARRVRNFSGLGITEKEAAAVMNRLDGGSGVPDVSIEAAAAMVEVDTGLRGFRELLADPEPSVIRLGPHRLVMLDSAHDVGMVTSATDALRTWWGSVTEDETTFVGGSPNCEGISDGEFTTAVEALDNAPAEGLVIVALHAPLVNMWRGEYAFFLRESLRGDQNPQVLRYLARHSPDVRPEEGALRAAHPDWFDAAAPSRGVTFVKRGDSKDLLDFGVSRGRADDLLDALAGRGRTRKADVVLAGHTHHHNEMTVREAENGQLALYLDHYTENPAAYYPSAWVTGEDWHELVVDTTGARDNHRSISYVELDNDALSWAGPHDMPVPARHGHIVQVPPYHDPLNSSADPVAWWAGHRPLLLQTGALGPRENPEITFSGFRLLSVRDDVIRRVDFVPVERLERNGFALSLAEAVRVDPPRPVRHLERSRRFGTPPAAGVPCLVRPGDPATHSIVYRDTEDYLVELWDVPGSAGGGRLAERAIAPAAGGDPTSFQDMNGVNVVLYRAADGAVHSLYWNGTEPAGHDALSAVAGSPTSAGTPSGWTLGGMNHVVYRRQDGHLHEIWWTATDPIGHNPLTPGARAVLAAGDPMGYPDTTAVGNVVVYRAVDGHVHSLYWSDGPTGTDNLSAAGGAPQAAGDPFGYFTPHNGAHQVAYRAVDGRIWELWWGGGSAAQSFCPHAPGAPAATGNPAGSYVSETNTKHLVYRDADGHLHDLAWVPGGGIPMWTDLTAAALAPRAAFDPVFVALPGSATCRVVYRGTDAQIHEIRWG